MKFTDQVKFNLPDVPFYAFKNLIGFDLSTTKSILVFRFGGYVGEGRPEAQQKLLVAKVEEMSREQIVLDIIKDAQTRPMLPAPATQAAPPPVDDDDMGLDLADEKAAAEAKTKARADAAKKTKAAAAKKAKADAEAKAAAEAALAAQAAETPEVYDPSEVSDQDLIDELGLDDL